MIFLENKRYRYKKNTQTFPRWPPKQGQNGFLSMKVILFSGFWLVICLFLGFWGQGIQIYQNKFNMVKIQDGRQNCMKYIYLALKADIQLNLDYHTAFYRFLGSRNRMDPKWITSDNPVCRKSKMAVF